MIAFVLPCAAQTKPISLDRSRYEIQAGGSARIAASGATLDVLLNTPVKATAGFVVGLNRAGDQAMLAAPLAIRPGEYAVTLSAAAASGELSQTVLDVVVKPRATVPVGSTRNPVVLLNGWETGYTNSCPVSTDSTETFGNLEQYLLSDGVPVVYFFDNCREDPNQPIETLAADLAKFLATVTYSDGTQVPQIDIVAHSIGGLIVRAYLAGLQPSEALAPPVNTMIGKLVLIATPNFGSFLAENYANIIVAGSQSAELIPGSSFLWNLATWNQHVDDLRGVNAIAVIGNAGTFVNNSTGASLTNASDGIVSETSASLGFVAQNASVTRVVPYCHVDPSAFTNVSLEPYNCNAPGIANVTSTSHYTGQIVRSFLSGTSTWSTIGTTPASDIYLTTNGGTYFGLVNGTGSYVSDISQVIWGTLTLQQGGDSGTIFFNDFVAGTGDFKATSSSLGTIDCGTITEATGYFAAARCKIATAIISVGPLVAGTAAKVVNAASGITIAGADFGSLCNGCKVVATPAGSTSSQTLTVTSWNNTSIAAKWPSSLSGFVTITVMATTGNDSINVMVAPSAAPAVSVAPASLQFSSSNGSTPPSQSIQISNSGGGTLSWTASSSAAWLVLSSASGTAPSTVSVSINPVGVAAGTYTGTIQVSASGVTDSVTVTLTVQSTQTSPAIASVVNGGSFQAGIAAGSWVSIFGTNLSSTTYTWQASDFVNGQLPTSLQGVSVTIDGIAAYVAYVSPTQINVLAPDDGAVGNVLVQVTVNGQQSNIEAAQKQLFAPAFFTGSAATVVVALHADYSPITSAKPAVPGETVLLYGTGFGNSQPSISSGQLVSVPAALASQVQVTVGGAQAAVAYAGIVESGLDQLNVTVPPGVTGDATVVAIVGGAQTQSGVTLPVQ